MSDNTPEEKPVSETATTAVANVREQPAFIDEAEDMFRTACDIAAEPWQNEALRMRAIVFLVRSGTRLREMEHADDTASAERERMADEREREIRRHEEMRAHDREHAEVNGRRELLETILKTVIAADAEGKSIDFSSMLNSALELKKLFDLILKQ